MNSIEIDILKYAKKFPDWHVICVFQVYSDSARYVEALNNLNKLGLIDIDKEKELFKISEKGLTENNDRIYIKH